MDGESSGGNKICCCVGKVSDRPAACDGGSQCSRSWNRQGETMFDRSKLSERGQQDLPLSLRGAAEPEERNCWDRKHTHRHINTHSERTDGSALTNTHTHAHTAGTQCCCGLCTQRGCQLTLTHLYSVMIIQCHAGTDYVKVSEGRAWIEDESSQTWRVTGQNGLPETWCCDLEMLKPTALEVLHKSHIILFSSAYYKGFVAGEYNVHIFLLNQITYSLCAALSLHWFQFLYFPLCLYCQV